MVIVQCQLTIHDPNLDWQALLDRRGGGGGAWDVWLIPKSSSIPSHNHHHIDMSMSHMSMSSRFSFSFCPARCYFLSETLHCMWGYRYRGGSHTDMFYIYIESCHSLHMYIYPAAVLVSAAWSLSPRWSLVWDECLQIQKKRHECLLSLLNPINLKYGSVWRSFSHTGVILMLLSFIRSSWPSCYKIIFLIWEYFDNLLATKTNR